MTVRNGAFGAQCLEVGGSNTNLVFDNNTHNNINARTSTCGDGRIMLNGSGVTVKNSLITRGDADGIDIGTDGVTIQNNRVIDVCEQDGPSDNHTDGIQFFDPNGWPTPTDSNNASASTPWCGGTTSVSGAARTGTARRSRRYNSGSEAALIEDNVIDTTRPWGIELYSDDGSVVRHNTVRYYPDSQCGFNGPTCGHIDLGSRYPGNPDALGRAPRCTTTWPSWIPATARPGVRNDHNVSGQKVTLCRAADLVGGLPFGRGFGRQGRGVRRSGRRQPIDTDQHRLRAQNRGPAIRPPVLPIRRYSTAPKR